MTYIVFPLVIDMFFLFYIIFCFYFAFFLIVFVQCLCLAVFSFLFVFCPLLGVLLPQSIDLLERFQKNQAVTVR